MGRLLFLFFFHVMCSRGINGEARNDFLIAKGGLNDFIANRALTLVLFQTNSFGEQTIQPLLDIMKQSSSVLAIHGIAFGVYNCSADDEEQFCHKKQAAPTVTAFLNGIFLVDLPGNSFFSESSVLSNSLQLLLIREVPLVQTPIELANVIAQAVNVGKDILLIQVPGIGSREHADFMQVAHAFLETGGKTLFVHTTFNTTAAALAKNVRSVADELGIKSRETQVYYLACRAAEHTADTICPVYLFVDIVTRGHMESFIRNVQVETKPKLKESLERHLTSFYCFYNNSENKQMLLEAFQLFQTELKGTFNLFATDSTNLVKADWPAWLDLSQGQSSDAFCYIYDGMQMKARLVPLPQTNPADIAGALRVHAMALLNQRHREMERELAAAATDSYADIAAVEQQDDPITLLEEQMGGRTGLSIEHAQVLDRKSFYARTMGVVLFHLKSLDPRSRLALRSYDKAASSDSSMATLDCYDWTDVCRNENVTKFPTARIYRAGKPSLDYLGPMDEESFTRLAFLTRYDCPYLLNTTEDVQRMAELVASKNLFAVIGLFSSDSRDSVAFTRAAEKFAGQQAIGVATGPFANQIKDVFSIPSLPAVFSYNTAEKSKVKVYSKSSFTQKSLDDFLITASLPFLPELSPTTLPLLRRSVKPLLMLFALDAAGVLYDAVQSLAVDRAVNNKFTFTFLNMNGQHAKLNTVVLQALSGSTAPSLPSLIVADYTKGVVYVYPTSGSGQVNTGAIRKWLDDLSLGNVKSNHVIAEGNWAPINPGYDFLGMMDAAQTIVDPTFDRFKHPKSEHKMQNVSVEKKEEQQTKAASESTSANDQKPFIHQHTEL